MHRCFISVILLFIECVFIRAASSMRFRFRFLLFGMPRSVLNLCYLLNYYYYCHLNVYHSYLSNESNVSQQRLPIQQLLLQHQLQKKHLYNRLNNDSDDLPEEQNTENSMAVLPSSICKLKKARGGGLLRTNSNGSGRKGGEDDEDEHYRSEMEDSDNTESPPEPLPLYQQRENYFT